MDASVHPVRAYRLGQKPPVTLENLAGRVGTTKTTLSRIETGKQPVTDVMLPRLVAETGIPADKLRPDLAKLFMLKRPRARRRVKAAA